MGAVPIFDTVVDPAMKAPENWVHMGGKRVAKKVVFGTEPTRGEIGRIAGKGHRCTIDRIPGYRGPAHVQPVVQVHLQLRAERTQGQFRQVQRILILRLPNLKITAERFARLDRRHPHTIGVVARGLPGRWHAVAIVVVEVAGKALAVLLDVWLGQWEVGPGRQVLQGAHRLKHMPVHEQKVDARAIAMLAGSPGVALVIARSGLPAQATQGPFLFLR
ncbi:hypothetical protein D3C72_1643690 [compost metagenome]